jgi:hypothetical protein
MTMKDYFSMLKSSVMLQCPACLIIRVQPNTYIEKNEHFWTASHLVKERGWLKQQRLQYPRGMGNSAKLWGLNVHTTDDCGIDVKGGHVPLL